MRHLLGGALSGLLLVLAFPPFEIALCAWVALVPLLYCLRGLSRPLAVAVGAAAGVAFHLGNLTWISDVMVVYGGLDRASSLIALAALLAYLSLYWAAFGWLVASAEQKLGERGLLLVPFFWVGLELARNYPFGGFPWCLLGYSQVGVAPVLQLVSLTGVHGLSFLIAWVNAALAFCLLSGSATSREKAFAIVVPALVLLGTVLYGREELAEPLPAPEISVAAIQGNVLQENKWDPDFATQIFQDYLSLSTSAADQGAELIVWPEASVPFHFDGEPAAADFMRRFVQQRGVHLLFGGNDFEYPEDGRGPTAYNGAKLLDDQGELTLRYRKVVLVPFGEYVPLASLLGVTSMVDAVGDFRPGEGPMVAPMTAGNIGAFICYEAIYSGHVRQFVLEGANLLVNITNDAWFGSSAAPYQHFAMAVTRAAETRRYLVRAANTGISAFVDPYGRVESRTELFEPRALMGMVAFREERTFYVRYGNLTGGASAVVTLLYLAAVAVTGFKRRKKSS